MSDLVKVFSPAGEPFENSPANARDLVIHAGWSYTKPKTDTAIPAPVAEVAEIKVIEPEVIVPSVPVEEVEEVKAADEVAVEVVAPVEEVEAEEVVVEDDAEEEAKPTRGRKKKS